MPAYPPLPEKQRWKMTLAYDGSDFFGWQRQPNDPTIQQKVEETLGVLLRHPVAIVGASRTDSGVHALGQVAHFDSDFPLIPEEIRYRLNAMLPPTIRVLSVEKAPLNFHACHSALKKRYRYRISNFEPINPFNYRHLYRSCRKLDWEKIQEAANFLIGTHDFTSFSNESHRGAASRNAIRTLYKLDIEHHDKEVHLVFLGDGFLYQMVRNISGTLVEVGSGKRQATDMVAILAAKSRPRAGMALPSHALFLEEIFYTH